MKIETEKYFRFLLDTVTGAGGTVELGVSLTAKAVEEMKQTRHVVNCLGERSKIFVHCFSACLVATH